MQPIHIAAKNGCLEILKYIASLPGVDLSAVISTVKHKINIVQMLIIKNEDTVIHMYIYFVRKIFKLCTLLVRWGICCV